MAARRRVDYKDLAQRDLECRQYEQLRDPVARRTLRIWTAVGMPLVGLASAKRVTSLVRTPTNRTSAYACRTPGACCRGPRAGMPRKCLLEVLRHGPADRLVGKAHTDLVCGPRAPEKAPHDAAAHAVVALRPLATTSRPSTNLRICFSLSSRAVTTNAIRRTFSSYASSVAFFSYTRMKSSSCLWV